MKITFALLDNDPKAGPLWICQSCKGRGEFHATRDVSNMLLHVVTNHNIPFRLVHFIPGELGTDTVFSLGGNGGGT